MILPVTSTSLKHDLVLQKHNNISFNGITKICVVSNKTNYLSYDDMGSVIDKFRNILLNRKTPKTPEIGTVFSNIKNAFHNVDGDYFNPGERVGVLNSVFARIRTGSKFYLLSGEEAQEHYRAGHRIGLTGKYNYWGDNDNAKREAIFFKEQCAALHTYNPKSPTVKITVDENLEITKVKMTSGNFYFNSEIPKPVKKNKKPIKSQPIEKVSQKVQQENTKQTKKIPEQLTFDFI